MKFEILKYKIYKIFFTVAFTLLFSNILAQSGGPPMMTDDPGVVDLHKWEINLSVNTSFSDGLNEFEIPFVDINYGFFKNMHLKIEFPYTFYYTKNKKVTSSLGDATFGLKWKILDENKYFISVGTYPQFTFYRERGFLLPLLLEKSFGNFVIGEDFGAFFEKNNNCMLHSSTLISYKFSNRFDAESECHIEKDVKTNSAPDCYINFGCRYSLGEHIGLMASFGRQILAKTQESEHFFSVAGVQLRF